MKRNGRKSLAGALARAKNESGFTLVELIVVIAILGILAGVGTVGYSGYIKKANMAADEILLDSLNTAFAAACVENGVDARSLTAAQATATIDGTITPADYQDEFDKYYEGGTFKVIESLVFSQPIGAFVNAEESVGYTYGDTVIYLSQVDVKALKESTYGTKIGPENLMGKVDYVTKLAASLMDSTNSTFVELINSAEYGQILADTLGINLNAEGGMEAYATACGNMMAEITSNLVADNPEKYAGQDATDENSQLYKDAYNQIVANNAVMYAAKNSSAVSDDILSVLGGSNAKGSIVTTINSGASGEGLAQAAMAYGLYTAYAANNNITVSDNPADVLLAIDSDSGFKDYINDTNNSGQAQKDLEGYLAAMNMINTNVDSNKDAVTDILVNGFANDNLVDLLQQAMK